MDGYLDSNYVVQYMCTIPARRLQTRPDRSPAWPWQSHAKRWAHSTKYSDPGLSCPLLTALTTFAPVSILPPSYFVVFDETSSSRISSMGSAAASVLGPPVAPRDSAQSAQAEVTAEGRVAPCAGAAAWTVHAVLAVVRDRATAAAPAGDRSTGRAPAMRGIEIQRFVGLVGPPLGQPLSHFLADPGLLHRSPVVVSWLMIHRCNTKSSISRAITVGLSLTFSTTLCMTFSHCAPGSERTRHI